VPRARFPSDTALSMSALPHVSDCVVETLENPCRRHRRGCVCQQGALAVRDAEAAQQAGW